RRRARRRPQLYARPGFARTTNHRKRGRSPRLGGLELHLHGSMERNERLEGRILCTPPLVTEMAEIHRRHRRREKALRSQHSEQVECPLHITAERPRRRNHLLPSRQSRARVARGVRGTGEQWREHHQWHSWFQPQRRAAKWRPKRPRK